MLAAWGERIFLLCELHTLFYLLGPFMSSCPKVLEHYYQLFAGCIHALAGLSPFATLAVFFLEVF
jgi:hypothetical protein